MARASTSHLIELSSDTSILTLWCGGIGTHWTGSTVVPIRTVLHSSSVASKVSIVTSLAADTIWTHFRDSYTVIRGFSHPPLPDWVEPCIKLHEMQRQELAGSLLHSPSSLRAGRSNGAES